MVIMENLKVHVCDSPICPTIEVPANEKNTFIFGVIYAVLVLAVAGFLGFFKRKSPLQWAFVALFFTILGVGVGYYLRDKEIA